MNDPPDITNWLRLSDRITTSGQPTEPQLAAIAGLGVKHMVNLALHTHPQALADEGASVGELGMRYVHIPVDFAKPTDADFSRFCMTLADVGDDPAHVHCIVNARVSAFFFRYRRDILGWDDVDARPALNAIWRPGGVWASFIGDNWATATPHQFAGQDY